MLAKHTWNCNSEYVTRMMLWRLNHRKIFTCFHRGR
uniref:Uncharacterized protein n=1 Tax=Arundo donax TaxID=35708 RepID=A0A0A9BKB4_ARUDO